MTKFLIGFFSFGWLRGLDFLAPLLLRIFLAPILWVEGSNRLGLFSSSNFDWLNPSSWINPDVYAKSVEALSNTEGLIGIPFPEIMNGVIGGVEIVGAFLLLIGFAVRWISIPLMVIIAWMGLAMMKINGSAIDSVKQVLLTHGYQTPQNGSIEAAVTIFLMLLTLFFMGAGRFFSVDWLIFHKYYRKMVRKEQRKAAEDPFEVDKTDTHTYR